jgi:hypothetical protein
MSGINTASLYKRQIVNPAPERDGAGIFQPASAQPISQKDLIKRLDLGAPNSKQRGTKICATLLYAFGADRRVAVAVCHQGSSPSDVIDSASSNLENLKREWQQKGGQIPSFNDAIRAALVSALRQSSNMSANLVEEHAKTAAADAKKTFPHDPGQAYDLFTQTMRNKLFVLFNNTPLPPKVYDINQCKVVVGAEGGDLTVRLVAKKPYKPKS